MDITIYMVKSGKKDLVMGQTIRFYEDHVILTTSASEAKKIISAWSWAKTEDFTIIKALVSVNTMLELASACIHGNSFRGAEARVIDIEYIEH